MGKMLSETKEECHYCTKGFIDCLIYTIIFNGNHSGSAGLLTTEKQKRPEHVMGHSRVTHKSHVSFYIIPVSVQMSHKKHAVNNPSSIW